MLKCHYCGTPKGQVPPCECSRVTEATIRAELEAHHVIWIPFRKNGRTPLQFAKRDVLMKLVYTRQITIDVSLADDPISENCWAFINQKPKI